MDEVLLHGGLLIAQLLKQEGVEVVFTLSGGHIAAIYDGCVREGIQSASYPPRSRACCST